MCRSVQKCATLLSFRAEVCFGILTLGNQNLVLSFFLFVFHFRVKRKMIKVYSFSFQFNIYKAKFYLWPLLSKPSLFCIVVFCKTRKTECSFLYIYRLLDGFIFWIIILCTCMVNILSSVQIKITKIL